MATKKAKPGVDDEIVEGQEAPKHFAEWECKIKNGEAEKLKLRRPCVKISAEEAETLNAGVLGGLNTYGLMYFPAD